MGVAGDAAWLALALDQKNALGAGDQQINLVNRAVIGNEFEIGPSEVVILGGETGVNEIQRLLLPRKARRRNGFPMLFRHTPTRQLPYYLGLASNAWIPSPGDPAKLPFGCLLWRLFLFSF